MRIETPTGRAIGGAARSAKMTPEERSAAASKAALAKVEKSKLPKATHFGSLKIGEFEIPCAVLENGTRIFTQTGIAEALIGVRSGASMKLRRIAKEEGRAPLPVFLAPGQLKPFISNELMDSALAPISYVVGEKIFDGFEATILPSACDVWLSARQAGALQRQQLDKAFKAEVLMRSLAKVGVIALVDEATGYQKDRAKNALAEILEKFVAKELQPWVKTFPADYYEQLFRLYNLPFPPEGKPQWRPSFIGHITNNVVYDRLAPELLPELKKLASKAEKKARLHQCLTNDIGHPKLREHLASIVTLLKISKSPDQFRQLVDQVHPRFGETYSIDFN